jgi:intracellular proteinase inhibitor BsuPI
MTDSPLIMSLATDQPRYQLGQPITLSLTVSNPTGQPVVMRFNSAQRCDFTIQDQRGNTLWQWGADRMFAQVLGEETLGPGGSTVYRERFGGHLPPGTYRAIGTLLATGGHLSAEAPVTVSP